MRQINDNYQKNIPREGVEILCIGTELLLGEILNSNAKWLAEELAFLGISHYRQTVVGDNFLRLKTVILEASNRSRFLITTGGLGPTPDDITTETIAAAFSMPIEEREDIWNEIKKKLDDNNGKLSRNNHKQAYFPIDATIISNPTGTAPGMIWSPIDNFTILTFPGVPSELKKMWSATAVPWLRRNGAAKDTFYSKTLKFTGIPESTLSEEVADLLIKKNPTVAPYAGLGEVKLRITAKGTTVKAAEKLIIPVEKELRIRSGEKCYGSNDDTLASVVLNLLRERGETLSVAESCSGGRLAAALTAVPGSSDVFLGGVVAYNNSIKQNLLGVSQELINQHGAVSEEVVEAMALGACQLLNANWSIAISGVAGPSGGTPIKPVGLVHIAVAGAKGCESKPEIFSENAERQSIQELSVLFSLNRLRLLLLD